MEQNGAEVVYQPEYQDLTNGLTREFVKAFEKEVHVMAIDICMRNNQLAFSAAGLTASSTCLLYEAIQQDELK